MNLNYLFINSFNQNSLQNGTANENGDVLTIFLNEIQITVVAQGGIKFFFFKNIKNIKNFQKFEDKKNQIYAKKPLLEDL